MQLPNENGITKKQCQYCKYFKSLQCSQGILSTNLNELGLNLRDIEQEQCESFIENNFYNLKEDLK